MKHAKNLVLNWVLLLTSPVWAPIHLWVVGWQFPSFWTGSENLLEHLKYDWEKQ